MCRWLIENGFEDTPLHFSRFFPVYKMNDLPPTPLDTLINAREIARQEGLKYVYIGNIGEIQGENTICPSCGRIIVRRNGFEVLEKHISKDKCAYCDTPIAGKW
jgi:pyruvate formate lyase activating enzyme